MINKDDLPGAVISDLRTFNGPSLFGYINGGAELYLEYGFRFASTGEIEYRGGRYKTEIFGMADPEAAFGIYSVSKFRCPAAPDIPEFACQSRYQLQICKGSYYISIINRTGSVADSLSSIEIGRAIAVKISDEKADFRSLLEETGNQNLNNSMILVRGKLGIMNGSPDLEDYFYGLKGYTALIVPGTGKKTVSVRFGNAETFKEFHNMHGLNELNESSVMIDTIAKRVIKRLSDFRLVIDFNQ
ncbi:MAG: hypothetical protein GYA41_13255 [Bacteroidales bacterium]|nr:hypothetical protein [Bacteroidales bacterium]